MSGGQGCGLQVTSGSPYFREGETLSVQVACTSGLSPAEAGVEVFGLPDGAIFGSGAGILEWETDGRDGGRLDLTFTAPVAGGGPPETEVLTLWVADDPDAPRGACRTP